MSSGALVEQAQRLGAGLIVDLGHGSEWRRDPSGRGGRTERLCDPLRSRTWGKGPWHVVVSHGTDRCRGPGRAGTRGFQ
jgi:hypothetical protein